MFSKESLCHHTHDLDYLFNGKFTKMFILNLLPFSLMDGDGFLEFVAVLYPKWTALSLTYFLTIAAQQLHHQVLQLVVDTLKESTVQSIHLATDMQTSCQATVTCALMHTGSPLRVLSKV